LRWPAQGLESVPERRFSRPALCGGPYRFVRHPIYTALLAMYAGAATVSGQLHALIGLALAVFAYLRKIRLEEANLMNAFGADYRDYRRETGALFPGLL
jgi:protein-S-isoprenylcysteine O-methyltransferase Ste14